MWIYAIVSAVILWDNSVIQLYTGGESVSDKHSTIIEKSIYHIIHNYIEQKDLQEMLLQFVNYQAEKGFPFGELLLLHYQMFHGMDNKDIYTIAASIEILMLSFDILDDIEDEDSYNKPWSTEPKLVLNAASTLPFIGLSVIQDSNFKNKDMAFSLLMKYCLSSAQGQHKDLLNYCQTEASYIETTLLKSGSLAALACSLGAILANVEILAQIESYGKYIGLIGQINNDINDIKAWNHKNDLLNKKYSLPIIYYLNIQDEEAQLVRDYYQNKISKDDILVVKESLNKKLIETGAITYAEVIKKIYQNKVLAELSGLKIDQYYIDQLIKYIY